MTNVCPTDSDTRQSTTAYDAATHTYATSSNGPTDIATTADYDARGRTMETGLTPRGGSEIAASERAYDNLDRVESIATLPDSGYGIDASFTYSDAGRLETVTDPLERTATIAYDSAKRVIGVTSAEDIHTRTDYDGLGRVMATFVPAEDATPTVMASQIRYDGLSRVDSTEYFAADGSVFATLTPTYDIASRVTGTALAGEATASVATTYDDLDRPADVTATGPAGTFRTQVTYDVADLPTNITYTAFGQTVLTVANTYAKTNQLQKSVAAGKTWSFGFGQGGQLTNCWSDRSLSSRSFDVDGRLSTVRAGFMYPGNGYFSDLFESGVAYDALDRVSATGLLGNAQAGISDYTDEYEYDLADRLTSWTRWGAEQDGATYDWDAAGNLVATTQVSATTTFTSDADNRLTTAVTGSAVTTYTSDAYGRRTTRLSSEDGTTTYTWDPLGHLTEVASADATSTYEYGIYGMRERVTVETTAGVTWTESVWSGGELISERDSDGTLLTYVWGPDRTPLAVKVASSVHPSGTYYYHTDAQGTVVALTDEGGQVVASYRYDAFGEVTDVGGSDGWLADRNPLRYRSYYLDRATGLYYLPARYYEPETARFLSPDPAPPSAGDPLSLNAYAYCQGDPVNASDPSGAIVDYDGNGKADAWDSAMNVASRAKSTADRQRWASHAHARFRAATYRAAMVRYERERREYFWNGPSKPDEIDMMLNTAGAGCEGLMFLGGCAAVLGGAAQFTPAEFLGGSPTATAAAGVVLYSGARGAELALDYGGLMYVARKAIDGRATLGDIAVQVLDLAYTGIGGSTVRMLWLDPKATRYGVEPPVPPAP